MVNSLFFWIINYYIIEIKKFLIDKLGIRSLSKINNEKMINDFEIFENSINLKTPPDILYKNGEQTIDNNTLAALTLLIAESNPKEKDVIIDLVMNFLNSE